MNKLQRKTYTKPILSSEAFVPNTYVAACAETGGEISYSLVCNVNQNSHSTTDGCRVPGAFTITIDKDGCVTNIYERPNNSGNWNGGDVDNLKINGIPYDDPDACLSSETTTYNLTWTTRVGKWGFYTDMPHSGTLNRSTAPIVKNMS